jgi:hypothetical protein|tara:strand:+ start:12 stop:239 length:228 start_codon:yes stop_codon:yes gene_type:complete
MTDIAGGMINVAWLFIGCGVWAVMMGAMTVHCLQEELTEREFYRIGNDHQWGADYESLENEQWQEDQDEWERVNQ